MRGKLLTGKPVLDDRLHKPYFIHGVRFTDGVMGPANAKVESIQDDGQGNKYVVITMRAGKNEPEITLYDVRPKSVQAARTKDIKQIEEAVNSAAYVKPRMSEERRRLGKRFMGDLLLTPSNTEPEGVMLITSVHDLPGGNYLVTYRIKWHGATNCGIIAAWKDATMLERASEKGVDPGTPYLQTSSGDTLQRYYFNGSMVREERYKLTPMKDEAQEPEVEAKPRRARERKPGYLKMKPGKFAELVEGFRGAGGKKADLVSKLEELGLEPPKGTKDEIIEWALRARQETVAAG